MQLSRYILETQRLIRDRSALGVSVSELTDYVNQARNDVAQITGCIRCLIAGNAPFGAGATPGLAVPGAIMLGSADTTITTFATLPRVERYPYRYARPFLRAQWGGVADVIDIIEVAVSWGAASRPVMDWVEWEVLQALGRIYSTGAYTYPFQAAKQGEGVNQSLFLFPVPSQALEMEWDAVCLPLPLNLDSDVDAIPEPYSEAVKFLAAKYCYQTSQRFASADIMEAQAYNFLGIARGVSSRGAVPSYYDVA